MARAVSTMVIVFAIIATGIFLNVPASLSQGGDENIGAMMEKYGGCAVQKCCKAYNDASFKCQSSSGVNQACIDRLKKTRNACIQKTCNCKASEMKGEWLNIICDK